MRDSLIRTPRRPALAPLPAPSVRAPLLAVLVVALVATTAGCGPRGTNLLAEDQARAANEAAVVRPTERSATTRPADLEAAPVITLTLEGLSFVPTALTLPAGLYRFRVMNLNERPVYFWLRRAEGGPQGGDTVVLATIADQARNDSYALLEPGAYLFSAPMPPDAPAFRLTVE